MMNQTPSISGTPRRGRRRALLLGLILLAGAAGAYAGARWHSSIAPMLGLKAADTAHDGERPAGATGAKQIWTCGMHPQVIQDKPGDCPICHMKLTPLNVANGTMPSGHEHGAVSTTAQGGQAQPGRKVRYWWDPMLSPPYISDRPGKSPMGMDLIPVYEDEGPGAGGAGATGAVVIDPAVVQNMGVRVQMVTEGPIKRSVRLVGYLDEAQPNVHDVNLRVSGWVRRLHASTEGQHVEAGDPLFDLYSPELQVAIEELITARRARRVGTVDGTAGEVASALYDAAASKLELLGLDPRQIEVLAKLDKAPGVITFTSPVTGHVMEKPIVEGAAVSAGQMALRIVDHTTLWLDAQVFEKDLPFVGVGQAATATVASRAGEPIKGRVVFIHPHLDMITRTATVRLEVPNPDLILRPGMYATVRLESQVADRAVLAPREAIIDTGESQMAFVAEAVGRFQPRKVWTALPGGNGMIQVVEGLAPGEAVVTSGQFLIDSESRLREAIQKFLSQQASAGNGPGAAAVSSPAATVASQASPEQQQKVDALLSEYLSLSSALGAAQQKDTPLDLSTLISAAHALHGPVAGTRLEPLALDVAKAAEAMKGHPLDHQRRMFSMLGERVIALADALPPSRTVAETLYVMNCPMAPGGAKGDWVQTSPDVANPFFATEMKTCGTQVRQIAPQGR
jgi:membrane fusion protein, copper/silver efflux system